MKPIKVTKTITLRSASGRGKMSRSFERSRVMEKYKNEDSWSENKKGEDKRETRD